MKTKKFTSISDEIIFPKLHRLRIESLEFLRKSKPGGSNLTASISRKITVSMLEKSDTVSACRVNINVVVDGNWGLPESEPVITFLATYNAKLNFPDTVEYSTADHLLSDDFYRQALVAQVIPRVHAHMYSQLEMMGIATNSRSLGLDFSQAKSVEQLVPKLPRKKNSSSK